MPRQVIGEVYKLQSLPSNRCLNKLVKTALEYFNTTHITNDYQACLAQIRSYMQIEPSCFLPNTPSIISKIHTTLKEKLKPIIGEENFDNIKIFKIDDCKDFPETRNIAIWLTLVYMPDKFTASALKLNLNFAQNGQCCLWGQSNITNLRLNPREEGPIFFPGLLQLYDSLTENAKRKWAAFTRMSHGGTKKISVEEILLEIVMLQLYYIDVFKRDSTNPELHKLCLGNTPSIAYIQQICSLIAYTIYQDSCHSWTT